MKEAFGGAFMIRLVIIFIVIYISFMAVAVNYAKAFRVKNQVINMLEQSKYKTGDGDVIENVENYLDAVPYYVKVAECKNKTDGVGTRLEHGVCIYEKGVCSNNSVAGGRCYYVVETYIAINFPFFADNMKLPIRGETKTIVY